MKTRLILLLFSITLVMTPRLKADDNLLDNCDFPSGMSGWTFKVMDEAEAKIEVITDESVPGEDKHVLKITVEKAGKQSWAIRFSNNGTVPFEENKAYKLEFTAKGEDLGPKSDLLTYAINERDHNNKLIVMRHRIEESWKKHSETVQAMGETSRGRFAIDFKASGTYYISNLKLTKVE